MTTPRTIFFHIPKTGGTTIRRMFRARYPADVIFEPPVDEAYDPDYLRYVLEETDEGSKFPDGNPLQLHHYYEMDAAARDRVTVFIAHFFSGIHTCVAAPNVGLTMVRDPIDRLLSLYSHRVTVRGMSISLERYLTSSRDFEIDNGQTHRLAAPVRDRDAVTETMFDVAREYLVNEFSVVGVTERFDESVIAFGHELGWPPSTYEWANRSPQRLHRAELPAAVLDELHERNVFDLRLHQFAHEHLDDYLSGFDAARALRQLAAAQRSQQRRAYVRRRLYRANVVGSRAKQAVKRLAR